MLAKLVFEQSGHLSGSVICNGIDGSYRIANGLLIIENLMSTAQGCELTQNRDIQIALVGAFHSKQITAKFAGTDIVFRNGHDRLEFARNQIE